MPIKAKKPAAVSPMVAKGAAAGNQVADNIPTKTRFITIVPTKPPINPHTSPLVRAAFFIGLFTRESG
jgi:hypothetical protein